MIAPVSVSCQAGEWWHYPNYKHWKKRSSSGARTTKWRREKRKFTLRKKINLRLIVETFFYWQIEQHRLKKMSKHPTTNLFRLKLVRYENKHQKNRNNFFYSSEKNQEIFKWFLLQGDSLKSFNRNVIESENREKEHQHIYSRVANSIPWQK